MARLPNPGSDQGTWGNVLNDYLSQSLTADGNLKADSVGSSQLQADSVTSTELANNSVTAAIIVDGAITETQLNTAVQTKLNTAVATTDPRLTDQRIPTDASVTNVKLESTVQVSLAKANTALQAADVTGKLDVTTAATTYVPVSGAVNKSGIFRLVDSFPEVKTANGGAVNYNAGASTVAAWDVRKQGNGRLLHLVADDAAGTDDLVALGLDAGTTNGLLVANKAGGNGIVVGNHPSATAPGLTVTNYSKNALSGTRFMNYDGAATIKFVANNGQGFSGGVTTLGSTTFTCATAAFTVADVGAVIMSTTSIDGAGIDVTTTVASYVNATTITLSKPAISTSSQVNFLLFGRTYSTTQRFLEMFDTTGTPFQITRVARTEFYQNVDFYPTGGVVTNQNYVRQTPTATLFYQYNGTNYTNTRWIMRATDTIALRMYAPAAAGAESVYTDMLSAKKDALGFFGAAPVVKPTGTPAAATDLATVIALTNSLRASMIALGLIA